MENRARGVWRPKSPGEADMQRALGSVYGRRLLSNKLAAGFAARGVAPPGATVSTTIHVSAPRSSAKRATTELLEPRSVTSLCRSNCADGRRVRRGTPAAWAQLLSRSYRVATTVEWVPPKGSTS